MLPALQWCGRVVHGFAAATTYSGGDFRFTFHEMEPRLCLGPCLGPCARWPTQADPPRFGAAGHAPPRGKLCFVAALGRSSIPAQVSRSGRRSGDGEDDADTITLLVVSAG